MRTVRKELKETEKVITKLENQRNQLKKKLIEVKIKEAFKRGLLDEIEWKLDTHGFGSLSAVASSKIQDFFGNDYHSAYILGKDIEVIFDDGEIVLYLGNYKSLNLINNNKEQIETGLKRINQIKKILNKYGLPFKGLEESIKREIKAEKDAILRAEQRALLLEKLADECAK